MATDQTEVPVGKVIGIGLFSIAAIIGVHYGVWSYFHMTYGEAQRRSAEVPSWTLSNARESEARHLASINSAMQQVAGSVGTDNRPAAIGPRPSVDLQALQGWGLRPRIVPNPPPARGDLPAGAATPTPGAAAPTPGAAAPAAPVPAVAPAPVAAGAPH